MENAAVVEMLSVTETNGVDLGSQLLLPVCHTTAEFSETVQPVDTLKRSESESVTVWMKDMEESICVFLITLVENCVLTISLFFLCSSLTALPWKLLSFKLCLVLN